MPPGEETRTYLELNASAGEVELIGELVARPGLVVRARPSEPRWPRETGPAPTPLRAPRARLQGLCAGNGDTFCVRLDGSVSSSGTRSETPLELHAPLDVDEPGAAYCDGGTVPSGLVFVVTRIEYRGIPRGEPKGRPGFTVVVGGERVFEHKLHDGTEGTWRGRIEIPEGGEKLTRLEIHNASAVEAILYGEFAPSR